MSSILIEQIEEDYYTLGQAAKASQYNAVTLWRWIRDGKLEAHRIGREVLIEKRLVDALRKDK
jgi:excisionase family DNA binding protein